jgi:membrane-bound metal-dependent hydrolase YbcI (DUF457 family)
MHGRAHLLVGVGLGVVVAGRLSVAHAPLVGVAAVSALLPDLDTPNSDASKLLRCVLLVGAVGAGVFALDVAQAAQESLGMPSSAADVSVALVGAVVVTAIAWGLTQVLQPSHYFEHRGALHWPSTGVVLCGVVLAIAALAGLPVVYVAAFAAGWFSHLLTDACTVYGMPLLMPFRTAREHMHYRVVDDGRSRVRHAYRCHLYHLTPRLMRWKTGSVVESPLAFTVLAVCVAMTLIR